MKKVILDEFITDKIVNKMLEIEKLIDELSTEEKKLTWQLTCAAGILHEVPLEIVKGYFANEYEICRKQTEDRLNDILGAPSAFFDGEED